MATSTRILTLSLSSSTTTTTTTRFSVSLITSLKFHPPHRLYQPFTPLRVYQHFRPLTTTTAVTEEPSLESSKHSILLERLRIRHLKDYSAAGNNSNIIKKQQLEGEGGEIENKKKVVLGFNELGLSEEVLGALGEMGITVPTEIQCLGIPQVLDGKSVVLGSHTGSGKTLAYLLPLVQSCIR
ncbi:putative RNA helicase [Helianthus annuus]|nr:putative RNA helicase [Helianthus annuus]